MNEGFFFMSSVPLIFNLLIYILLLRCAGKRVDADDHNRLLLLLFLLLVLVFFLFV